MRRKISKNSLKQYYKEMLNRNLMMDLDGVWIDGFKFDITDENKLRLLDISSEIKEYFYNERCIEIPSIFDVVEFKNFRTFILEMDVPFTLIADDLIYFDTQVFSQSMVSKVSLKSCKHLGDFAFANCHNLKFIDIPNIKYIGESCFNGDKYLSEINISNVKKIGIDAFYKCTSCNFIGVDYPNLLQIGEGAFSNSNIKQMCANKLKVVPNECFKDSKLVYFRGDNVREVQSFGFNSSELSKVDLPNLYIIGFYSFSHTLISEFVSNLRYIANMPFSDCKNLKFIKLPNVKKLETLLVKECPNLELIELNSCKRILGGVSSKCNLKELYLPSLSKFSLTCCNWDNKNVIIYLNKDCEINDMAIEVFGDRLIQN